MNAPLRLGIAGLGTVGIGVVKIVRQHNALLEARTGRKIEISGSRQIEGDTDSGSSGDASEETSSSITTFNKRRTSGSIVVSHN